MLFRIVEFALLGFSRKITVFFMKKSVLGLNLAALEVYCIFLILTEILSTEKKEQQTSWQKYGNQTGTKNGLKQACESGRMLFISLES